MSKFTLTVAALALAISCGQLAARAADRLADNWYGPGGDTIDVSIQPDFDNGYPRLVLRNTRTGNGTWVRVNPSVRQYLYWKLFMGAQI